MSVLIPDFRPAREEPKRRFIVRHRPHSRVRLVDRYRSIFSGTDTVRCLDQSRLLLNINPIGRRVVIETIELGDHLGVIAESRRRRTQGASLTGLAAALRLPRRQPEPWLAAACLKQQQQLDPTAVQ